MIEDMSEDKKTEVDMVETIRYLEERGKNISRISDKLRKNIEILEKQIEELSKQIGVEYLYPEKLFYVNEHYAEPVYLCINRDHVLELVTKDFGDLYHFGYLDEASRDELIKVVKILPDFLLGWKQKAKETIRWKI